MAAYFPMAWIGLRMGSFMKQQNASDRKPLQLAQLLSKIHPLVYLAIYIILIPIYAALYLFITPHGFYAPYAKYESDARMDAAYLASNIKSSIQRTLVRQSRQDFVIGKWKLIPNWLDVDEIESIDGSQITFRIRLGAHGIEGDTRTIRLAWTIIVTVSEREYETVIKGKDDLVTYRLPVLNLDKDASGRKQENEELLRVIFDQSDIASEIRGPRLALNLAEELQFQRYLAGIKGDPESVSGEFARMAYFSAIVITTLGLGDIVPMAPKARLLVALEAATGIVFAGLFLNAIAYRASHRA